MKPYTGDKGYIFISYSHKDTDRVFPIIEDLSENGYRVWFDEGIDPGTEWDENIAAHMKECAGILAFVSENYLNSDNCKDELNYARDLGKGRIIIYLEEVELPAGMAMRLNRIQAIHKYKYKKQEEFYDELRKAPMLKECDVRSGDAAEEEAEPELKEQAVDTAQNKIEDKSLSKSELLNKAEYQLAKKSIWITAAGMYIILFVMCIFGFLVGGVITGILTILAQFRMNYIFSLIAAGISLVFVFFSSPLYLIILAGGLFISFVLFEFDRIYKEYRVSGVRPPYEPLKSILHRFK